MKYLNYFFKGFLSLLMLSSISCVDDDTVVSDKNELVLYEQSVHLVSILNNFSENIAQPTEVSPCFDFVYPIKLIYNTEATVELKSYSGLRTAIINQSDNFNLEGLVFPIDIIFSGTSVTQKITSETELLEVLTICRIKPFKTAFDEVYDRCFQLQFPISLGQVDKDNLVFQTQQELTTFMQNQPSNFQPQFIFPITIVDEALQTKKTVTTYYEIYQIINACPDIFELCPAYDFSVASTSDFNLSYTFERINNSSSTFSQYDWTIDGIVVKTDGGVSGSNILTYDFSLPGFYTVCIVSTEACVGETQFCKEINIPAYCAPLSFVPTQLPNSLEFNFTADFVDKDVLEYNWLIDGVLVEANDGGIAGDNLLNYTFAPGSYDVCIEAASVSCPEGMQYCIPVEVLPICPQLAFTYEKLLGLPLYRFTADFPEKDDITYSWYIDDAFIEADGGAAGGDNLLQYNLLLGVYEVCIRYQSTECPEGVEFCEIVTIL
ncbi:hypothetical protein ACE939_09105 [Aquimarina sp. W85]|uniref:hypothetical protein n=1 Tax=Aquimarina rhodophyticola TaxID=3342246 RepID=UPI003672A9A3